MILDMHKTYKYRLSPTKQQITALEAQLEECRRLYNAALEERRDAWERCKDRWVSCDGGWKKCSKTKECPHKITFFSQTYQLKHIRAEGSLTAGAPFVVQRDVLKRVDLAFQAFYRRCRNGEKPGYPRFKGRKRYDSMTGENYPSGIKLKQDTKRLSWLGVRDIKVKLHRPIPEDATIKSVTIRRSNGDWYACFSTVLPQPEPLAPTGKGVGVDVGLENFATHDDGTIELNPKHYTKELKRLRRLQRGADIKRKSRTGKSTGKKPGSKRLKAARHHVARLHERIRNRRCDAQHKYARALANDYDTIVVEKLNIKGMARGLKNLRMPIHDAAWGQFFTILGYKAEEAGRKVVEVNPSGTSQTCVCGAQARKRLSERKHVCTECGLVLHRDHMSAMIILGLGHSPQDESRATGPGLSCTIALSPNQPARGEAGNTSKLASRKVAKGPAKGGGADAPHQMCLPLDDRSQIAPGTL
jgi:putative transposase